MCNPTMRNHHSIRHPKKSRKIKMYGVHYTPTLVYFSDAQRTYSVHHLFPLAWRKKWITWGIFFKRLIRRSGTW
jgi:hypothetical protein